ncbi:Inner membrane protein alx [compost metagenome]
MEALYIIVMLVLMEGLLSVDNALVLGAKANTLRDPSDQKKALRYGMFGAFFFRAVFIFLGVWLIKLWAIKLIGALYLAKLVYDHFSGKEQADEDNNGVADANESAWFNKVLNKFGLHLSPLWTTIIAIEFMDLTFSVDSILAALALSDKFWVLFVGGCLGIVMMRGVAGLFIKLIDKYPLMNHTAYILIALIAVKMGLGTVHNIAGLFGHQMEEIHIGHITFFIVVLVVFLGTFVVQRFVKPKAA